ncbi:response regulator [Cognatazoarcus halotolerans]|uniref:response regulator n=1 Tax=Cognatazoarcus halotolerans TaxID=2686016 RepID=UPI00135925E0|nr:response regulator [Cognatazoarcus halotolerans]MCB1901329.1 response regulator [Rhodocyclaceae bacterium]MCP5311616.1 response regulator [Zoogloeaceae bacterium]
MLATAESISTLIIEPQPGMRAQVRNMLALSGVQKVEFAVSAGAAVRKLRDQEFDLVLCEFHLGDGQDGQHLLEDLRQNAIIPLATVFIMLTGERQYEKVVGAAELAPNDYILKPFAAEALFRRIARALEKRDALLPAYRAIERQDTPTAIACCHEGRTRYPQWQLDFMRLEAELHIAVGEAVQAEQLYKRILELRAVPWARLGLAKSLFAQKRFSECEQILESLVSESDQFIDAYELLARAREAAGQLDEARDILAKAHTRSPYRVSRTRKLGELSLELGDPIQAEEKFSEVVRLAKYSDFRNPEDHVQLAAAQLQQGNMAAAETTVRDLERSMAGLPTTSICTAMANAMLLDGRGDKQAAREALTKAMGDPENISRLSVALKARLADTCLRNDLDGAASQVALEMIRSRGDAGTLQTVRNMFARHDKTELSGQLESQVQQEVRALISTGAQKAKDGDFNGAVSEMMNAVRRLPGNPHVLFNAALALLRHIENCGWNEQFAEQARRLAEQVRIHDPENTRLPALNEFRRSLLKKYGIAATQP